jgi:hypothetical protein
MCGESTHTYNTIACVSVQRLSKVVFYVLRLKYNISFCMCRCVRTYHFDRTKVGIFGNLTGSIIWNTTQHDQELSSIDITDLKIRIDERGFTFHFCFSGIKFWLSLRFVECQKNKCYSNQIIHRRCEILWTYFSLSLPLSFSLCMCICDVCTEKSECHFDGHAQCTVLSALYCVLFDNG